MLKVSRYQFGHFLCNLQYQYVAGSSLAGKGEKANLK